MLLLSTLRTMSRTLTHISRSNIKPLDLDPWGQGLIESTYWVKSWSHPCISLSPSVKWAHKADVSFSLTAGSLSPSPDSSWAQAFYQFPKTPLSLPAGVPQVTMATPARASPATVSRVADSGGHWGMLFFPERARSGPLFLWDLGEVALPFCHRRRHG